MAHTAAVARLDALAADCFAPLDQPPRPLPGRTELPADVRRTMSSSLYQDGVRAVKEHIVAGDVFQVVLSQRFDLGAWGPTRSTSTGCCAW